MEGGVNNQHTIPWTKAIICGLGSHIYTLLTDDERERAKGALGIDRQWH